MISDRSRSNATILQPLELGLVSVNTQVREQTVLRHPTDGLQRQPEPITVEHRESDLDGEPLNFLPIHLGRKRLPALRRLNLPKGDLEREQVSVEPLGLAEILDAKSNMRE